MISDNCTLRDLMNMQKWFFLAPKDIQTSEQHKKNRPEDTWIACNS